MFKTTLRAGIAMIELIFAIVIMGIVLMSAPMLVSQATQAGMGAIQQEAIVAGASELGMILTRHWDEQNTDNTDYSPILTTAETIAALQEASADGNLTGRRVGTPDLSSRSFLTSTGLRLDASTTLGADGDDDDDIDDFNGQVTRLINIGTETNTEDGDYIDRSLTITSQVVYSASPNINYTSTTISFNTPFATAATGTSNIKAITTTVTSGIHDAVLDTNVILRAFSCNIGTYVLKERSF